MNLVAMGIVALNIAVAVALYYGLNSRIELPMMVGILCGAVTNTPGLGAANEALSQLNYSTADSDGICVRLSVGSAGYHWFYYCYPLHLPD